MTAPPIFPTFPGLTFPVVKSPSFSTGKFKSASGIRVRATRRISPLWTFKLDFSGLIAGANYPGLGTNTVQSLMGLILDQLGAARQFLLLDPNDSTLTNAVIGTGNGTQTQFVVTRTMGSTLAEPVGYLFATDVTSVTVAGSPVTGWSITAPNILVLPTAPASGAAVAISVAKWYFQVTFPDTTDFSQFLDRVYELKELTLESVVPNYPTLYIGY